MAKKIRGTLVSITGEVKEVTITNELESYYKLLDCDIIDCAVRRIGTKLFDIICDDEGLLKSDPKVTAIAGSGVALVGNLFICNHDDKGNWTSLSDTDIAMIHANTSLIFDGEKLREVLQIWV